MRPLAILTALGLLVVAAPALAHTGDATRGLDLDNLVLSFNVNTQAQVFSFDLKNVGLIPTGALFGTFTLHQDMLPQTQIRVSSAGLAPDATQHYDISIPARAAIKGCAFVVDTGSARYASDEECAQTQGLSTAPTPLPCVIPDTPALGVPAIPSGVPDTTLPEVCADVVSQLPPAPEIPTLPPADPPAGP